MLEATAQEVGTGRDKTVILVQRYLDFDHATDPTPSRTLFSWWLPCACPERIIAIR
jgi:hypothetical protein